MCEILKEARATDVAFATTTCDGRHRQSNQPLQCGYCSSCLLRRLAFFTAKVEDKTEYVATHGTKMIQSHYKRHFKAMDHQAKKLKLILDSQNEWQKISSRYPELREIVCRLGEQEGENTHLLQNELLHLL